jgi:hypothetical protein
MDLTEEQQIKYSELSVAQQKIIDGVPPNQKGLVIEAMWTGNNADSIVAGSPTTTTSKSGGTGLGGSSKIWTGESGASVADLSTSTAQPAIGVPGQRRVQVVQEPGGKLTTKVLSKSYTGFQPKQQPSTPYGAMPSNVRYFAGDEYEIATFKPEEIATIQQQMLKAGLLSKKYRIGIADAETVSAFEKVLGQANTNGTNWTTALGTLMATPKQGSGLTYRVSNPDDIRAVVQQTASSILGRSAEPAVVDRLVKSYQELQIQEQQGMTTSTGARTGAPQLDVFAEKELRKTAGPEADAFRFAQFAKTVLGS